MDQLIAKWISIQGESLGFLEGGQLRVDLVEECLDEMYQCLREPNQECHASTIGEFEKELQLKQQLALLLAEESLISSQAEMNIALWKAQPYVHAQVAKRVGPN